VGIRPVRREAERTCPSEAACAACTARAAIRPFILNITPPTQNLAQLTYCPYCLSQASNTKLSSLTRLITMFPFIDVSPDSWYLLLYFALVFTLAIIVWGLRSAVDSDPDPAILNLTFFAFVGQCIRTGEVAIEGGDLVSLVALLVPAAGIVGIQVLVYRYHVSTTKQHYDAVLTHYKKDRCPEREIEYWSKRLLHITGVDFYPGKYGWLSKFTKGEPREKRRKEAFWILPGTHFKLTTAKSTSASTVPASTEDWPPELGPEMFVVPLDLRVWPWRWYIAMCTLAWLVFLLCLIEADRNLSSTAEHIANPGLASELMGQAK
jgi:hypothetical protein